MTKIAYQVTDNWQDFLYSNRYLDALSSFFHIQSRCVASCEIDKKIYISYNNDISNSKGKENKIYKRCIEFVKNMVVNSTQYDQEDFLAVYLCFNVDFFSSFKLHKKSISSSKEFIKSHNNLIIDKNIHKIKSSLELKGYTKDIVNLYKDILKNFSVDQEFLIRPMQDSYKLYFYLQKTRVGEIEIIPNPLNVHADSNIAHVFSNGKYIFSNYIGVSKLCCGYCHKYLEDNDYQHRGTHGVCDHNWKMPWVNNQSIAPHEQKFKESTKSIEKFDQSNLPQQHRRLSVDKFEKKIIVNEDNSLWDLKTKMGFIKNSKTKTATNVPNRGEVVEKKQEDKTSKELEIEKNQITIYNDEWYNDDKIFDKLTTLGIEVFDTFKSETDALSQTPITTTNMLKLTIEKIDQDNKGVVLLKVDAAEKTLDGNISHWVGLFIDKANKQITYVDPMGHPMSEEVHDILQNELANYTIKCYGTTTNYLNEDSKEEILKSSAGLQFAKFTKESDVFVPNEINNQNDCGPFLIYLLSKFYKGEKGENAPISPYINSDNSKLLGQELRKIFIKDNFEFDELDNVLTKNLINFQSDEEQMEITESPIEYSTEVSISTYTKPNLGEQNPPPLGGNGITSGSGLQVKDLEYNLKCLIDSNQEVKKFLTLSDEVMNYNDTVKQLTQLSFNNVQDNNYLSIIEVVNGDKHHACVIQITKNSMQLLVNIIDPLSIEDSDFTLQLETLKKSIEKEFVKRSVPVECNIIYSGIQDADYGTCGDMCLIMIQQFLEGELTMHQLTNNNGVDSNNGILDQFNYINLSSHEEYYDIGVAGDIAS